MEYDLIIIGGGPAGLTAGIYAARRSLKTLIIAKSIGGQAVYAPEMENYPGFDIVNGGELMAKFLSQALKFGCKLENSEVTSLTKKDDVFTVETNLEKHEAKSVILAFGKTPKDLEAVGEAKYKGKGVSYCATCDALFFKGKDVAVVGGGNSAVDAALLLAKTSTKVYLIHRRDQFTAEETMQKQLKETPNIELVLNSVVPEIKGSEVVESVIVNNVETDEKREIKVSGVFVEIGFIVKPDFAKSLVDLDQRNQIEVDCYNITKTEGLFAAGDATDIRYKQAVIAAGEGAKAALSAYDYLMKLENKTGVYSGNN